jgi:hypothetical protein
MKEAFEKAQWLENRKAETLPITYFHVIFTTDHALNDLARRTALTRRR